MGHEQRAIAPLEAALRRQGQAVIVAGDGQQAAALARQFQPSVIVLAASLSGPPGPDWLAVLQMHPATAALPTVLVGTPPSLEGVLAAFRSGVTDIVPLPVRPEQLIARLDALLGSAHDAARRAAAIDRRGAAVLRRLGAFLRAGGHTGVLHVDAAGDPASVPFVAGELGETTYGDLKGDGALRALLSHPGDTPWGFRFDAQGATRAEIPPEHDDFNIEIAVNDDALEIVDVAEATPTLEGPPPRLLLVDDDQALIELYGKFLKRAGFEVHSASNGKQGYEIAVRTRPDVVLSDIMMPETDGWGFLTLVRDDYRLRETPFLLLSCHHDFVEKLRELEAGADDYLAKGMRGEAVVERVTAAVAPRRRILANLQPTAPFRGAIGQVGLQTLLSSLGDKSATGTLHVDDGLVRYAVGLSEGRLVSVTATANERVENGNEVLLSLLTIDDAPFRFDPAEAPAGGTGPRFAEMRDAVCGELNARRDLRRERMFADDAALVFDARLLAFYRMVCPDVVRVVIDALRPGTPPREVMGSGIASPVLIEWVVKDLLRKRIARFAEAASA